jgi:hypothetical protein
LYTNKFVPWLLRLLEKSTVQPQASKSGKKEDSIHVFCLDFASALLANLFHSHQVLDMLE